MDLRVTPSLFRNIALFLLAGIIWSCNSEKASEIQPFSKYELRTLVKTTNTITIPIF